MALGVLADVPFEQRVVRLEPGDQVLLYTDGITEATDTGGLGFGTQRLQEALIDGRDRPLTDLVASIEGALREHTGDVDAFDDVTMVAVRRQL